MSLSEKEIKKGAERFFASKHVKKFVKELQTELIENFPNHWNKIAEIIDKQSGFVNVATSEGGSK